ncbi:MAG: type II toxin-antitoxin system RelE/ParE family toxin [bacterium]|nr:type II toxin-antitoxin system RelE/ParE family toxin [bacterium]
MLWGDVELESEVADWYLALDERLRARVAFHIDRLGREGPLLGEPQPRQLDGKLRELRVYLQGRDTRVTYWIAPGRRIILLTVFAKSARQERRQVQRAKRAMQRCMTGQHDTEGNDDAED